MGSTPATWKCSKCKRETFHEYEGGPRVAKRGNPIPTGEFRRDARTTKVTLQYKCSICDFTGWTCHFRAWRMVQDSHPEVAKLR